MSIMRFLENELIKPICAMLAAALLFQSMPALASEIPLVKGWNLVSIPENLAETEPSAVLGSIAGRYDRVFAYNAFNPSDPWRVYDPADPAGSDLTSIDNKMGLWIHMNKPDTLSVSGTIPTTSHIALKKGLNIIGYPLEETQAVRSALASIEGRYSHEYAFSYVDSIHPWSGFKPAAPDYANDLPVMTQGKGYCLYATEDATLTLSEFDSSLVDITAPTDGVEVTGPTAVIGTVKGTMMTSYRLEYRSLDDSSWTAFAQGSAPPANDTLGTFDPTLLLNGMYQLRLAALDLLGYETLYTITVVVKGGMKIGNFSMSFVDLDVPVCGLPIQITRTYDSRDKKKHDFGYSWSLDIRQMKVQESTVLGYSWKSRRVVSFPWIDYYIVPTKPHIVTVTATDGSIHTFDMTLGQEKWSLQPPQSPMVPEFKPRPGTTSRLKPLNGTEVFINGTYTDEWLPLELVAAYGIFNPSSYELTLYDGRKLEISEINGLEKITDLNNNRLTVTQNGITHSSGKGIAFNRDSQGRISSITDPMSHSIYYAYDSNGDLTGVNDRDNYTTTFTYGQNHYLTDITDPRGVKVAKQLYDESGRMIAMVDAEGDTIHLTHNIGLRQEVVKDRLGNITVYEYDAHGNVISQTDAKGNTTTYTYDALGHKLTETDSKGNTRHWTYDSTGNMLTETNPLNNITRYTYNTLGQMLTKTDPMGHVTTYAYNAKGNRISETDASGHTIHYAYDAYGNLLTRSDSLDVSTKEYDSSGNVTKEIDALGHATNYTYDSNGNQLTQTTTRTTSSGPVTMTWTKIYDGRGNETSITDPDGNVTRTEYNSLGKKSADIDKLRRRTEYVYDSRGNETEKHFPDGTKETTTYDDNGNRTSSTDRAGRITAYEYDSQIDRIKRVVFPTGGAINMDTDNVGSYTAITDDHGNSTIYNYDTGGRLAKTKNALGDSTVYGYNFAGNQTSMTDANGNITQYEYDELGRKTKTIFPDNTSITTVYDTRGNKTQETDQAGKTTQFDYDPLNRLVKVTDAMNHVTEYTYDELGNKLTQKDALGRITRWEYGNLGQVVKRILPLGQEEFFTYDPAGNVLTHKDFNGNMISYAYDSANRMTSRTYPNSVQEKFYYTATGKQDTVIDARGTTIYKYDNGDRLIQAIYPNGSSISYGYDTMGNRTSLTVPSGASSFTYDQLNRLKTVTDPDGGVTTYSYDKAGNRKSAAGPNGTRAEYFYDSLNRLIRLENRKSNGSLISSYVYTLGLSGNRTKVTENSGRTVDYAYDDTYKLMQETISDPDLGIRTIGYTYDAVGNRLTKTDNGKITNYTYDNNDRLLTEVSELGTLNYSYDSNGNTISKLEGSNNTVYSYDYLNRLIQVNSGTSVVKYAYDTDGTRMQKVADGVITNYLVDKNRDYAQVLEERGSGGTLNVSYNYGDDLISQKRSGIISYYHYDGQLSTRQLTDAAQNITDGYTYDAFGNLINRFGATMNDYLYTGQQYDPNIGFYYLRARYMNPSNGRFLTMDTYPGMQFEPGSLHKYLYCEGNSINKWDPSGRVTTLIELSMNIAVRLLLTSIVTVLFGHLISAFLKPADWNGNYSIVTIASGPNNWAFGFILASLNGVHESEDGIYRGYGLYLILLAGVSYGEYGLSMSWSTISFKTPGIFKASPFTLVGAVSILSATWTWPKWAGIGPGISSTFMIMGMGYTPSTFPGVAFGKDRGIDCMVGISWPLQWRY